MRQLDKLGSVWPDQGPKDEQGIAVYVEALIDLDPVILESAVLQTITRCRFYPKPAEIREAAVDLELKAEGLPDPYEAWGMVQKAIRAGAGHPIADRRNGPHAPDPVERAVQYLGGWAVLGMSESMVADRARFIEAYREVRHRTVDGRKMLPQVHRHIAELADRLSIDDRNRKALTDSHGR